MKKLQIDNFITTKLGEIDAYLFMMKVKDILPIYYVAVRGRDNVPGAVQRVLNKRRISSIKEFVLNGNIFFNMFLLNWVDTNYSIEIKDNKLLIPQVSAGAQVIDGQHRLEGIKQAYEVNNEIGEKQVIVLLTKELTTPEAAKIFLNINTEQKPVPNSLVYDLFGEVKDKKFYVVRATDIAYKLNDEIESPYYQCIKKPGTAQGVGKVDLSTIVNAIKQFTKEDGLFTEYHLTDFESQYKIFFNFFSVLKYYYDKEGNWLKSVNPFMANAGCYAGIEFMCKELIPKCVEKKSFEIGTIKKLIPLDVDGLIYREDLKNKQGKEQRSVVYQYLKTILLKDVPTQDEYKF